MRGGAAGSPARARRQPGPAEFHCGKPPPAAAPRTIARSTVRAYRPGTVASTWIDSYQAARSAICWSDKLCETTVINSCLRSPLR